MRSKDLRKTITNHLKNFNENDKKEDKKNLKNDGYSRLNEDALNYMKEEFQKSLENDQ